MDANQQFLAYVYSRETLRDAQIANVLTEDEARRIASNIAKLPGLLQTKNQVRLLQDRCKSLMLATIPQLVGANITLRPCAVLGQMQSMFSRREFQNRPRGSWSSEPPSPLPLMLVTGYP